MTKANSITSMLTISSRTKGSVVFTEEELHDVLEHYECKTKTDMIMALHDLGIHQSSIAKTLLEFGVLSQKSSRQHVRNTIERKS